MAFLDETGLAHLWSKTTNKFLAKANVANNLTTTSEGYALDARQGVALMSAINGSSGMKLSGKPVINVQNSDGTKNITLEKNAFCSFATKCSIPNSDHFHAYATVTINENNTTADICGSYVSKTLLNTNNYSFAVLPKGTSITLTVNELGTALAAIQYFE